MNHRSRIFFTAGIFALCVMHNAMAQRIPDLSLSPAETAQQTTTTHNNPTQFQNDVSRRMQDLGGSGLKNNGIPPATPSKRFMDGYCDPSFIPILANNRKYFGMEQCLQQQRDESCARFANLPQEVKDVLDDAISCLFTNGNGYAADKGAPSDNDYMACGLSYARRIEMLKKYMADGYSLYALVYLPDNVLDTGGACLNRK